MAEESVTIHDKYQFEIKVWYKLEDGPKRPWYKLETYFFLPQSLGVNRNTYSKHEFYNDMQSYIRFKTPSLPLRNIVNGPENPWDRLKNSIEQLSAVQNKQTITAYKRQIKMFCSILKSALRDHVQAATSRPNLRDARQLLDDFLANVPIITSKYRELRPLINLPGIEHDAFSVYLFGDEYVSLLVNTHIYNLLEYFSHQPLLQWEAYRSRLLAVVRSEVHYRQENNYPSVPGEPSANEEMISRRSALKKYMGSVLFLDTRVQRDGIILEQIAVGVAAGLAMVFATTVAFISQHRYGPLTLPFFMALVVSYMFKDRIKELLRNYMMRKMHSRLQDHRMNILSGPGQKIGMCSESMDFIADSKTPPDIGKLRSRKAFSEIENDWAGERIILYRKQVRIFPTRARRFYHPYPVQGINDIMRFNVSKFLHRMDDPIQPLYVLAGEGYNKIQTERTYHFMMIIKYTTGSNDRYHRFRVSLNRNGIKTIDEIPTGN